MLKEFDISCIVEKSHEDFLVWRFGVNAPGILRRGLLGSARRVNFHWGCWDIIVGHYVILGGCTLITMVSWWALWVPLFQYTISSFFLHLLQIFNSLKLIIKFSLLYSLLPVLQLIPLFHSRFHFKVNQCFCIN